MDGRLFLSLVALSRTLASMPPPTPGGSGSIQSIVTALITPSASPINHHLPSILNPAPLPSRWIWEYSIFTALVIVFGILRSVIFFEGAVSAACHYLDLYPPAPDPDRFRGGAEILFDGAVNACPSVILI